jgi:hypothetical protein
MLLAARFMATASDLRQAHCPKAKKPVLNTGFAKIKGSLNALEPGFHHDNHKNRDPSYDQASPLRHI